MNIRNTLAEVPVGIGNAPKIRFGAETKLF
jgi:hypothetical protein